MNWARFVFFAALGGVIGSFAYEALKYAIAQNQTKEGV